MIISVWYFLAICFVAIWVAIGWWMPLVSLGENQALYIFSSQAQVVAAVYGLTITGYIFLHNQQDRLADKDETVADALDDIKMYQYCFITFLTIVSLMAIFLALMAIAFRDCRSDILKVITQNSSAALFVVALICTGYFVRDAMRPNKIEEASDRIKKSMESKAPLDDQGGAETEASNSEPLAERSPQIELSPVILDTLDEAVRSPNINALPSGVSRTGGFEQFLSHYNRIEQSLELFASMYLERPRASLVSPSSLSEYQDNKSSRRSNWTKPRIVNAMLAQGLIGSKLAQSLLELTKYRNALVHGGDFSVAAEMLERVKKASEELDHVMFKQSSY